MPIYYPGDSDISFPLQDPDESIKELLFKIKDSIN